MLLGFGGLEEDIRLRTIATTKPVTAAAATTARGTIDQDLLEAQFLYGDDITSAAILALVHYRSGTTADFL